VKNHQCIYAFGLHLRQLRKRYKLSQQNLADRADIDKKTIQKIEMNRLNPSLDILCSLAIGFNIELQELMMFKYEVRND
jgi:DNA-binding XRE family transcriptional regulator